MDDGTIANANTRGPSASKEERRMFFHSIDVAAPSELSRM